MNANVFCKFSISVFCNLLLIVSVSIVLFAYALSTVSVGVNFGGHIINSLQLI